MLRDDDALEILSGRGHTQDILARFPLLSMKERTPGADTIRWQKPNVLILRRHEYYRKLMPTEVDGLKFDSIHDLERQYQITATIQPDGKAAAIWKRQKTH